MVFDELFESLLPERVKINLPIQCTEDISTLYDAWYRLQFEKYHINETTQTRSDISFSVLEKVVSELSLTVPSTNLFPAVEKNDAIAKVNVLRDKVLKDSADRNANIDLEIEDIKARIKDYCISTLQNKDFKINLTLTLYENREQGKLEFDIPSELRVPIFYMFNDTPPNLNLSDEKVYHSLYNFTPKNVKDEFNGLKPKYVDEDKTKGSAQPRSQYYSKKYKRYMPSKFTSDDGSSAKHLNETLKNRYANHIKKYLSKIIGIQLPDAEKMTWKGAEYSDRFSIPIGIRHEPTNDRYDATKFDTNVTTLEIFLYAKDKGILYTDGFFMDKTDMESESWKYDKPRIRTLREQDLKFDAADIQTKILTDAAGKIIATFAKNNIAYKLRYREVILPIKNPNRND